MALSEPPRPEVSAPTKNIRPVCQGRGKQMINLTPPKKRQSPAEKTNPGPKNKRPRITVDEEHNIALEVEMERCLKIHSADPLAEKCWKMFIPRSQIQLYLCLDCRNKFIIDPRRIMFLKNGEGRISITLCRNCCRYAIDHGERYRKLIEETPPQFDNQLHEHHYNTSRDKCCL